MSFDPGRRNEVTSKHVDVLWAWAAKATLLVLPTLPTTVPVMFSSAKSSAARQKVPEIGSPLRATVWEKDAVARSAPSVSPVTPSSQIQLSPNGRGAVQPAKGKPYLVASAGQPTGERSFKHTCCPPHAGLEAKVTVEVLKPCAGPARPRIKDEQIATHKVECFFIFPSSSFPIANPTVRRSR